MSVTAYPVIGFRRNNINYRIATSNAIASYKQGQAFMLNELVNGKHPFSEFSREVMLLAYDTWYKWVNILERLLFSHHDLTDYAIDTAVFQVHTTEENIQNVLFANPNIFIPESVRLWQKVHAPLTRFLVDRIKGLKDRSCIEAFPIIVDTLNRVLNSTLFELHEIDRVAECIKGNCDAEMFISVDEVSIMYHEYEGFSLPAYRYNCYTDFCQNVPRDIVIKFYVEDYNPDFKRVTLEDFRTIAQLKAAVVSPLEELGAKIVRVDA